MSLLHSSHPAITSGGVRIPLPKRNFVPLTRCVVKSSPPRALALSGKHIDCYFRLRNHIPFFTLSAGLLSIRCFFRILPPDFSDRWMHLVEFSQGAEEKLTSFPHHLIQAVLACEDRRFFYHIGFDPYGIGRAVVFYPKGGGGSTITQQLVKNVFLTSERKISRKFVEGILSLILERRLSKWEILYAYLNKMYWGHGKYGIEAASLFYFGKSPSLLNIGESALLAGILPGPEALNPFTNPKKGKASQARALRRMVAAGFLGLDTALMIVGQALCLNSESSAQAMEPVSTH